MPSTTKARVLRISVFIAWALAVLLPIAAPRRAEAFCRTTTKPVPADFQPRRDACWDKGMVLWWRNACVAYSVHRIASRQVAFDPATDIITRSFTKWTGSYCQTDGSGNSRASIDVRDLGPVNCGLVQYSSSQANQNVITFRDDAWPHNDASNTLALTTVVFNPETGEIYDADMEVNTFQHKMQAGDPVPTDGYDFESIMTHEAGHFLGMAHSGDPNATMYASYTPGATRMRQLTVDDVHGICTVYPPDGNRVVDKTVNPDGKLHGEACEPTPRHGFSTECAQPVSKGCFTNSVAQKGGADPSEASLVATFLSLLGLCFLRRKHGTP